MMASSMKTFAAIVASVEDVAPDVRLFRLLVEHDAIPREPGGHVDVEVQIAGHPQIRSYSILAFGREDGLSIAVKRISRGHGGSAYMWSLAPGARLRVSRARNNMPVTYTADSYLLLAGGIGITPMTAVARSLCAAGKKVLLRYCVRSRASAPFVPELEALLGESLTVHDSDAGHRLDVDAVIGTLDDGTICYVCGPLSMMEAVKRAWHGCSLPGRNLRFETFGNSGRLPSGSFEVIIRETGLRFVVPETESLLDVLLAAGQDVMYECRRGECGLCKVEIDAFDGVVDHRDVFLSEAERSTNRAMCCCVSRVHRGSVWIRIDGISHGRSNQTMSAMISRRP